MRGIEQWVSGPESWFPNWDPPRKKEKVPKDKILFNRNLSKTIKFPGYFSITLEKFESSFCNQGAFLDYSTWEMFDVTFRKFFKKIGVFSGNFSKIMWKSLKKF